MPGEAPQLGGWVSGVDGGGGGEGWLEGDGAYKTQTTGGLLVPLTGAVSEDCLDSFSTDAVMVSVYVYVCVVCMYVGYRVCKVGVSGM